MPIRIRFWLNSPISPERTGGIRASERWTSGSRFVASRWRCQVTNPQIRTPPAAMTKRVSEKPKMVIGEFFGLSHPQVLDWRTPKTKMPRPLAESTEPTTSSFGVGSGRGASPTLGVMRRMKATMITSPTKTIRHVTSVVAHPPRIGPTAIPAPATPPMIA